MKEVFIVSVSRTPIGSFGGSLSGFSATDLGASSIRDAYTKINLDPNTIQEVFYGNVVQANLGQAPARQAAIKAGLNKNVITTTVNKVCASGMKSVALAAQSILLGQNDLIVAGGMESMTNAPHLLPGSRTGVKYGSFEALDHMAWDGLVNPYDKQAMGVFGELCADKHAFSREAQDAYAAESVKRALAAQASGAFKAEIAPVTVAGRKGDVVIDSDDAVRPSELCELQLVGGWRA